MSEGVLKKKKKKKKRKEIDGAPKQHGIFSVASQWLSAGIEDTFNLCNRYNTLNSWEFNLASRAP